MSGYATTVRIGRPTVHPRTAPRSTSHGMAVRIVESDAGGWMPRSLAERVGEWRVLWRQTTYFLFDPERWP